MEIMFDVGDIIVSYSGKIAKICNTEPVIFKLMFLDRVICNLPSWIIERKANKSEAHKFKLMESGNYVYYR